MSKCFHSLGILCPHAVLAALVAALVGVRRLWLVCRSRCSSRQYAERGALKSCHLVAVQQTALLSRNGNSPPQPTRHYDMHLRVTLKQRQSKRKENVELQIARNTTSVLSAAEHCCSSPLCHHSSASRRRTRRNSTQNRQVREFALSDSRSLDETNDEWIRQMGARVCRWPEGNIFCASFGTGHLNKDLNR